MIVPEVTSQEAPAVQAGIKSGDVILAVDGQALESSDAAIQTLMTVIRAKPNQPIDFKVKRGDQQLDLNITPQVGEDGVAKIGVQLAPNGSVSQYRRPKNLFEVLGLAAEQFQSMFITTVQGFWSLITNFSSVADKVSGPVKIVEQGSKFASANARTLFPFTAIISINLAIINILPLPALDGGQLAFLLIEGLRGKPLPAKLQENVMQTGLVLLLGLGLFLMVRDTTQLEVFQRLFQ